MTLIGTQPPLSWHLCICALACCVEEFICWGSYREPNLKRMVFPPYLINQLLGFTCLVFPYSKLPSLLWGWSSSAFLQWGIAYGRKCCCLEVNILCSFLPSVLCSLFWPPGNWGRGEWGMPVWIKMKLFLTVFLKFSGLQVTNESYLAFATICLGSQGLLSITRIVVQPSLPRENRCIQKCVGYRSLRSSEVHLCWEWVRVKGP